MAGRFHRARLVDPKVFRGGSYITKEIAPGVKVVFGKRPKAKQLEAQALLFDVEKFTPAAARSWATAHDYVPSTWESPARNPGRNIEEAAAHLHAVQKMLPIVETCAPTTAKKLGVEVKDALEHIDAATRGDNPCKAEARNPTIAGWAVNPDREFDSEAAAIAYRHGQHKHVGIVEWKRERFAVSVLASKKTAAEAKRDLEHQAKAIGGRVVSWHPYTGTKTNPPGPRQLVRLADVLSLEFTDGRTYNFPRSSGPALLVEPGVEKESAGKARIVIAFLNDAEKGAPPHKTSERTFETWMSRLPRSAESLSADVPGFDEFREHIGTIRQIRYRSDKWSPPGRRAPHDYFHDFGPKALPDCHRGPRRSFMLSGGAFRITARGIVG